MLKQQTKLRVRLYARLSKDDGDADKESNSITNQLQMLRYNAKEKGFEVIGEYVDVTGKSIGKGFQGTVKRWNFGRGPMAHGSKNHREPGSIGAGTTPSRVIKGKRMAGNMGNERVTITKLKLVKVDAANGLVLVKGSVPGCEGRLVTIVPTRTKWNA